MTNVLPHGGGGGLKSTKKKFHVLFEWRLTFFECSTYHSNNIGCSYFFKNVFVDSVVSYNFNIFQTRFGKIFWSVALFLMLVLGLYWCIMAYKNWTSNPVLTTIITAELPVEEVNKLN